MGPNIEIWGEGVRGEFGTLNAALGTIDCLVSPLYWR
jgi:hypothetical protein